MIGMCLLVTSAQAVSIDEECDEFGFPYGIVKYEWNGTDYVPEDDIVGSYVITLDGDDYEVDWTADPNVAGVIRKSGGNTEKYPGGSSGTVTGFETTNPQGKPITQAISHITFCGCKGGNGGPGGNGVPEFTTGTLAVAVIAGCLGLAILRKR
jgi:hypothetical protein